MKILLLQPPLGRSEDANELKGMSDGDTVLISMGLYSIATVLIDEGFEVSLLNHAITPWSKVVSDIKEFKPDLIGITCLSHNRHAVLELADTIKEMMPSVKVALGGVHATTLFDLILRKHQSVDYIAIGEAETSFLELANRIKTGESTLDVKGIVQRKPGHDYSKPKKIIPVHGGCDADTYAEFNWVGQADPIMDLETLPIPAKYFKYSIVSTARGCPFACTFCSSPQIWGRKVRNRPIEHVLEELTMLRDKHGVTLVYFKDETFTINKKRIIKLCQAMIEAKLNLLWTCDTRTDCLNEEVLYWMRKAGCYYMSVGVESGSETMLTKIRKKTNIKKAKLGSALARKFGMMIRYYIIANLPDETTEDRQKSIEIIEEGMPNYITMTLLLLSPGTELYYQYCENNNKDDNIWFDDKREWIPYYEDCTWADTEVGQKLLHYKSVAETTIQFPYTEAELRGIQDRLNDCFGPNFELARYLFQNGRFIDAIPYFEAACEIWPDYVNARIALGISLINVSRASEARDLFVQLSNEIDNIPEVWLRLGDANKVLKDYAEAENCYQRVLSLQPGHSQASSQLSQVMQLQGKEEEKPKKFILRF